MKTIILAGSGHAHLEVIGAFSKTELAAHKFILISPHRQTYYSGLIPRLIAGEISTTSLTINSADFAEAKGFTYIQDSVQSVDSINNCVTLASQKKIQFDLLSLNVGGELQKITSESPLQTIYLRPFDEFMLKWHEAQKICNNQNNPKFIVVGGGAAAVEVATALRIRLNKNQAQKGEVHLVSKGPRLCQNYSEQISASIKTSLLNFNIRVHLNEQVTEIFSKYIHLHLNKKIDFDLIFVVTPTVPSKIISEKIDSTLRISQNIFAVGDGTEMRDLPKLPRSGVIAVHQGRHLIKSIRNILLGLDPTEFQIRTKQLNILITGENTARLVWGGLSFEGTWPLHIKNWIDQHYIKKFKLS
jgi:NADH dehydrogenase FAD-containing subunit